MLNPAVVRLIGSFCPFGHTPAVDLARNVPPGFDADILLLGWGDIRNILYTAYSEKTDLPRKLDLTCSDIDSHVLVRNIVILSFFADDAEKTGFQNIWDFYYHPYLKDTAQLGLLRVQAQKLLHEVESWDHWHNSRYGRVIKFCDRATFDTFKRAINSVASTSRQKYATNDLAKKFLEDSHQLTREESRALLLQKAFRSSAPVSVLRDDTLVDDLSKSFGHFLKKLNNSSEEAVDTRTSTHISNPLFLDGLYQLGSALHSSSTNPLLGYHLAVAHADLATNSPLSFNTPKTSRSTKAEAAAFAQFSAWARSLCRLIKDELVMIRAACTDPLTLCHTLQHCGSSPTAETTAHLLSQQLRDQILELDGSCYGTKASKSSRAPKRFDGIDTSTLADDLGVLSLVLSAGLLLKSRPWAGLTTETGSDSKSNMRKDFERLLGGDTLTIATMIGLTLPEYWTNATITSGAQYLLNESQGSFVPQCLTWVPTAQLSCHGPGPVPPLKMESEAVLAVLWRFCLNTFDHGIAAGSPDGLEDGVKTAEQIRPPWFHSGTLIALMKEAKTRVDTNWDEVTKALVEKVRQDTFVEGGHQARDLMMQMHLQGLYTDPWLSKSTDTGKTKKNAPFAAWKQIPEVIAVSLVIPAERFKSAFGCLSPSRAPLVLALQATVQSEKGKRMDSFGNVQLYHGDVNIRGSPKVDDFAINVTRKTLDLSGYCWWDGPGEVLASFYCPTALLQADFGTCVAGLRGRTMQENPGQSTEVFSTLIDNGSKVYFTKYLPGQSSYPIYSTKPRSPSGADGPVSLSVDLDAAGKIKSFTSKLAISDDAVKILRGDKPSVKLRQTSPFILEVSLGQGDFVYPVTFPLPVDEGQARSTAVGNTLCLVVNAPVAHPTKAKHLQDFLLPVTLTTNRGARMPTILSCTLPHVNLDALPILELSNKGRLGWLKTLASYSFSSRERWIRERTVFQDPSLSPTTALRTGFKDSLFTMFMIASGLQGSETGLFAIERIGPDGPGSGAVQMIIAVSAVRLDSATGGVVFDAAVLPLSLSMLHKDGDMGAFLALMPSFKVCFISVDDDELELCRRALPAIVERCRTWAHGPACEYSQPGATVPLSSANSSPVLCSCGRGRLPEGFVTLPEWDTTAAKYATRVAISPLYSVAEVEELVDQSALKKTCGSGAEGGPGSATSGDGHVDTMDAARCWRCGMGPPDVRLDKCATCRKARYCSRECQRTNWKLHKLECRKMNG